MTETDTAFTAAVTNGVDPEIVALEARIRLAQLNAAVGGFWRVVGGHVSAVPNVSP